MTINFALSDILVANANAIISINIIEINIVEIKFIIF